MKRYQLLSVAVLGTIALVIGGISPIYAQEEDSDEFILEEITVTAQKRAESQQKVAIQMEVVTGEDLVGTGKDNMDDILRDVSSVIINKSEDGMRVSLRGLTDDGLVNFDLHNSTPMVAVNIDGAHDSSSASGLNLFDVERVEVLAGPQSTLYGSNSPGGIVNVVTASPKTDKFSANASAEFGNYGLFDGQLAVNVPIIQDLLAMRLSGQMYQRDSWVEGIANEQDTKTVRLKTTIQPTENFDATITLNYSEAISGGRLGGTVLIFDTEDGLWYPETINGPPGTPPTVLPSQPVTNPWTTDSELGRDATANFQRNETRVTEGIQAEINWDTAFGAISFVPFMNESSNDSIRDTEIETDVWTMQIGENVQKQEGAELRVASPEDFFFQWILGGTYYKSEAWNGHIYPDYPSNDSTMTMTNKNKALYGNLTYPLTDALRATAGYRRSWDDASSVEVPPKFGTGLKGNSYENPDYKLALEYDVNEDAMLYASWATSYRVHMMAAGPEFQEENAQREVPPEELKAWTLGVKSRLLDNKLQVNASAYFYDYRHKEIPATGRTNPDFVSEDGIPIFDVPGTEAYFGVDFNDDGDLLDGPTVGEGEDYTAVNGEPDLLNSFLHDPWESQFGNFESIGVDVSIDWVPTAKDRLGLSVSWLDAGWVDAETIYFWEGYFGHPLVDAQGFNYNGVRATYSPEWSVSASYQHRFELGSFGTLVPVVDMQYKSDYDLSIVATDAPWNYQESYAIYNASLNFTHASDRWALNAYVKNIGDYAAKTWWANSPTGISGARLGISDPQTFGAVLSVKF